jgi:outer membrane lipoprotein carrier protein
LSAILGGSAAFSAGLEKLMNIIPGFFAAILFLTLLAPLPLNAEEGAPLPQVVATLEQGYSILQDVTATFSQRTVIASIKREERGSGAMYMKRSGSKAKFRFDYRKPQRQQIISDGSTLWYYQPDDKQVLMTSVDALFAGGNGLALAYLTGLGNVSKDFIVAFKGSGRDSQGNYLIDLVPRTKNDALKGLQLTIDKHAVDQFLAEGKPGQPFPVKAAVVTDNLGNTTNLEFTEIKTNSGLADGKFSFRPPAGVAVMRQ